MLASSATISGVSTFAQSFDDPALLLISRLGSGSANSIQAATPCLIKTDQPCLRSCPPLIAPSRNLS